MNGYIKYIISFIQNRLQGNGKLITGVTGILLLYFLALFAPQLSPCDPLRKFSKNHPPSTGENIFYLYNPSPILITIAEVRFHMWRRSHRDDAKEIVLLHDIELKPGETRKTTFRLTELGQTGELTLLMLEKAPEPLSLEFRFNLPPERDMESGDEMESGLGMDEISGDDRRLHIRIPRGSSEGRGELPVWLFIDSYMGVDVPDRLLGRHLFGTDAFERDVLSRLIQSARPTALVSLAAMVLAMLIGIPLGLFAGYFTGWTERTLMRISDIFSAFPRFFLIIAIVALWGQNILLVTIAIGITGWMEPSRFINAKVKTLMEQDYILAARSTGRIWWRIIVYDLIPNVLPHILVMSAYGAGIAVLMESSLSYVNLGVAEPAASWGNMLAIAHTSGAGSTGMERMWQVLSPGLAIAAVIISFNFLADGLKKRLGAYDE